MSLRPRPEVEGLRACPHGGPDHAELKAMGLNPEAVLDFSVCSNPFMPPHGLARIIAGVDIEQYPDSEATEFRERLSEKTGVSVENIIAGSGTIELIRLIALTYFRPGDPVLILEPTFGEYEVACRIAGAQPISQRAREEDGFVPRTGEAVDLIRRHQPRAAFICNPNNPTGKYLTMPQVEAVRLALGDGILILDEAYVAFVEPSWPATDLLSRGNVVVLRSMTKDYALAGLRLGYAIASQDIIATLRRVCPPWNVNAVAQRVGSSVLEHTDRFERTRSKIREAKRCLIDGFSRLGFPPLPSDANYFMVKVGDARSFRAALLKRGILVRDCASFGLPEYIRVAPRAPGDCRKLIAAVESLR